MDFKDQNLDMNFREFVEAQATDIVKLRGQNPFFSRRQQGLLSPKDPLNTYAAEEPNTGDLNVVWITGMWSGKMPGTGNYGPLLKSLGYNIRTVATKANVFAASAGRLLHGFQAPQFLKNFGQAHIEKNKEIYRSKVDESPDVIIGSSQGGAVALSLAPEHPEVPMLLICPAWRVFHVQPTHINPNSIIVHGMYDREVPISDSEYLAKKFNIPLFVTEDGHIIKQGFWQIVKALKIITGKVAKQKGAKVPQAVQTQQMVQPQQNWQGVTGS